MSPPCTRSSLRRIRSERPNGPQSIALRRHNTTRWPQRPSWPPEPAAVAAWLYLVVFGSLIAFNAYMLLLARASAGLASSYTFVNPVIAMLLGVAVLGEAVTGFEWLAAGVVLVGVVLMLRGSRRSSSGS